MPTRAGVIVHGNLTVPVHLPSMVVAVGYLSGKQGSLPLTTGVHWSHPGRLWRNMPHETLRGQDAPMVRLIFGLLLLLGLATVIACEGSPSQETETHGAATKESLSPVPQESPSPATQESPTPVPQESPTPTPAPTLEAGNGQSNQGRQDGALSEPAAHDAPQVEVPLQDADYLTEEIPPCAPIEGSTIDPCEPDVLVSRSGFSGPASSGPVLPSSGPHSVRTFLEGRSILTPSHLVVRGTFIPGTVRCTTGIPHEKPSYIKVSRYLDDLLMECYVDVRVGAYILGSGPSKLTVRVDWDFYSVEVDALFAERLNEDPAIIAGGEFWTQEDVTETFRWMAEEKIKNGSSSPTGAEVRGLPGKEAALFLGTGHTLAMESWAVHWMWDIQRRGEGEDETVVVVHPTANTWKRVRPDDYQIHSAALEMSIPDFSQAVTDANRERIIEYDGRIAAADDDRKAPGTTSPMVQTDANRLSAVYTEMGAYADPDSPPAEPPPPCGLALPDGKNPKLMPDCMALLEGKDILRGTGDLNWDTGIAIGDWDGITTGDDPIRVTSLELPDKGLTGSIPAALERLHSGLTHLDLSDNSLTGAIPHELGRLANLESLKLSGNSFTGCIPVALEQVPTSDLGTLNPARCSRAKDCNAAASGLTISAAADGVGARWSATKSAMVKSISWPTPLTTGTVERWIALATISSLNDHRSSREPPPRARIITSHSPRRFASSMVSAICCAAPSP